MISSCSAWMVATMSLILPSRAALSTLIRAPSPASSKSWPWGSEASSSSSSSAVTVRWRVVMWRRRTTPPGSTGVAW